MALRPETGGIKQRKTWVTDAIGGKHHTLAKGRGNKKLAQQRLKELQKEHSLLELVNGAIAVAHPIEFFCHESDHNYGDLSARSKLSIALTFPRHNDMFIWRVMH